LDKRSVRLLDVPTVMIDREGRRFDCRATVGTDEAFVTGHDGLQYGDYIKMVFSLPDGGYPIQVMAQVAVVTNSQLAKVLERPAGVTLRYLCQSKILRRRLSNLGPRARNSQEPRLRAKRHGSHLVVRIPSVGGRGFVATDVSDTGMFVATRKSLPVGRVIGINILDPHTGLWHRAKGEVVRSQTGHAGRVTGFGIRFRSFNAPSLLHSAA